jgi:hypothetical protein
LRLTNKNFFVLLIEKSKIKGPRPTPTKITKPEACSKLCPSFSSPHLKQQKIIQKILPLVQDNKNHGSIQQLYEASQHIHLTQKPKAIKIQNSC